MLRTRTFVAALAACLTLAGTAHAQASSLTVRIAARKAQRAITLGRARQLLVTAKPHILRRGERFDVETHTATTSIIRESTQHAAPAARSKPAVSARTSPPAPSLTSIQTEVLRLLNRERTNNGLESVAAHALLQQSAQSYAEDMERRGFFGHRSPEGKSSLDRIQATGYLSAPCACKWSYVTGENLAKGQATAAEVVRDWMNSPEHRENMLQPAYRDVGIGWDSGVWVLHLGVVRADE